MFVALVLLASGCSDPSTVTDAGGGSVVLEGESGGSGDPTIGDGEPDGGTGDPGTGGDQAGSGGGGSTGSPTPGGGGGAGPSGGGTGEGTSSGGQQATPLPSPNGGPGTYAPAYLRPAPYRRVVVELLTHDGAGFQSGTLEHSVDTLASVSKKSVTVSAPIAFEDGRRSWDGASIRAAADAHGRASHGGDTAVMRVLALRGEFGPNDGAIGVAVRGDVMAVFVDRVRQASTPLVGRNEIEKAVTLHEVGHLLGLVDLYLKTGRADPEHPGHSPSEESVMFWAVETDLIGQVLGGGPPTSFDEADRRDLATIAAGA